MSKPSLWRDHINEAKEVCRAALQEPALQVVDEQMGVHFPEPRDCYAALCDVTKDPSSLAALHRHVTLLRAEAGVFERWLLIRAAMAAMSQITDWPVVEDVKRLWADEAIFFARPPAASTALFSLYGVRFREMARIATLRRFPAGQFHWEISGMPRSYLLKFAPAKLPRILAYVFGQMRGFSPLCETHENARRKNRLTLTEVEGARSYYLLARSLEMQPHIKGLCTCSWLYCSTTAEVTPRLAWLREFLLKNGALIDSLGPAPPDAGFLIGSEERRQLYEQGRYRPTLAYVLWSRKAMLNWAKGYQASFMES
jgi:hypothetical protein